MRLHHNVGTVDRVFRFSIGLVLVAVLVAGLLAAPLAYGIGLVAAIMLVTGATGFCPLYALFRVSTCARQG